MQASVQGSWLVFYAMAGLAMLAISIYRMNGLATFNPSDWGDADKTVHRLSVECGVIQSTQEGDSR